MTTTIEDDGLRAAPIDEPALFAAWTEYRKHLPTGMGPEAMPKAMATVLAASIQAYLAALRSSPAVDGVGEEIGYKTEANLRRDGYHLVLEWVVQGVEHKARIYEPNAIPLSSALADLLALAVEEGQRQFGTTVTALRKLTSAPPAPTSDRASVDLTDEMVVAAMEHVPGCDHDDMVSALEAALSVRSK